MESTRPKILLPASTAGRLRRVLAAAVGMVAGTLAVPTQRPQFTRGRRHSAAFCSSRDDHHGPHAKLRRRIRSMAR